MSLLCNGWAGMSIGLGNKSECKCKNALLLLDWICFKDLYKFNLTFNLTFILKISKYWSALHIPAQFSQNVVAILDFVIPLEHYG